MVVVFADLGDGFHDLLVSELVVRYMAFARARRCRNCPNPLRPQEEGFPRPPVYCNFSPFDWVRLQGLSRHPPQNLRFAIMV